MKSPVICVLKPRIIFQAGDISLQESDPFLQDRWQGCSDF